MKLSWTVAQIGHREEYAAARAFVPEGRLRRLYTDTWCRWGADLLAQGPAALRKVALRYHPALRQQDVVAWSIGSLRRTAPRSRGARPLSVASYDHYVSFGIWFDSKVADHLRSRALDPRRDAFFSYNTGCLTTLHQLRDRGTTALVCQVNPGRVEYQLVREEAQRWPGWAAAPVVVPDSYFERREAEWEAAAGILVNSRWSAEALARQGIDPARIAVVPLAYERRVGTTTAGSVKRGVVRSAQPLNVLWLGQVTLRKGIQYLVEAARLLSDRSIRFVVTGPLDISAAALAAAPPSVDFHGPVTHDRVAEAYGRADVFVLPTVSDGFALTQLEAMSHGLPVVTTPNCGEVVEDGHDGLIVPARDPANLAAALARLDDDRDLLGAMAERAPHKAAQFSLDRFRQNLDDAAARFAARSGTR